MKEENTKTPLLGLSLDELQALVVSHGLPSFTAKQIADWIYKKRIFSIDEMSNISAKNRELLNEHYCVGRHLPVHSQASIDGTKKYLFKSSQENFIESVYIPESDRATLCVSSQVGCKMNCLFCMTGKQGFSAHLTATEILNQVLSIPETEKLTNVVFMGMGEPLDNIKQLLQALKLLTADYAYAWSPKRITVSTIGLLPGLKKFLELSDCHLALSMHNPFAEERLAIMPVEKAFALDKVLDLIREYDFSKQRRVSFEYIMFNGYNDSIAHAKEMIHLLKGISCRVNLIRFHAIPGVDLKTSGEKQMEMFRDYLNKHGVTCTIRRSRGEDIFAACGMLSTLKKKEKITD